MNGWIICMRTMLNAESTLCTITYALTHGHRSLPKGSLTWERSAPALTCLSLDAGVEMEAAQAQEGPEGGKLVRRGNAHFKGQEGEMVWWRVEDEEGKRTAGGGREGEKRPFVLHPHRGFGTLCTWAHLLWCVRLIPKAMSTWLAQGWKRQVTIQIILHPFMAISVGGTMRWRVALESCKPFRRCLLHYCSSS